MGSKIKKETSHIMNSYLFLGILEMTKAKDERDVYITSKQIMDTYDCFKDAKDISRSKKYVCDWMDSENQDIIKSSHKGFKLAEDIPRKEYKDFLTSFLLLSQISTEDILKASEELIDKEGEKPLSIVTKLYLGILKGEEVKLKAYENDFINFNPKRFFINNNNQWTVEGFEGFNKTQYTIKEIKSIKYP